MMHGRHGQQARCRMVSRYEVPMGQSNYHMAQRLWGHGQLMGQRAKHHTLWEVHRWLSWHFG